MHILQVLPHLSKGGAERVVVELSNALVDAGHEVTLLVAYPVDPILNQQYLDKRVKVQFASRSSTNRVFQYLKLLFWLVRYWKVLKTYDAIHCHLTYGLLFGSMIYIIRKFTNRTKPRLVATCHMVGVRGALKVTNEQASYFFDTFVLMAQNAEWQKFTQKKKKKNIVFIPNGISAKTLKDDLIRHKEESTWTIGTISRLEAERKPWLFLEVFSEILKSVNGDVRFIIGGEGAERESLSAFSEKLGLKGKLSMPGLIHDPKEILNNLDVYISLNVGGITGIAGLEAVFARIPVVGIQLALTHTTGASDWIWSAQDPKSVGQKIVELLNSRKMREETQEGQYIVATRDFSINRMRDDYLKLYQALQ